MKRILRILTVWLVFTMEVKVRAEVQVLHHAGNMDVLSQGKIVHLDAKKKTYEPPFEAEILGKGLLQMEKGTWKAGLGSKSHLRVHGDQHWDFFLGELAVYKTGGESLFIHTKHGIIKVSDGEIVVHAEDSKTQVSVVTGKVILIDRANQQETVVNAGFLASIGRLTSRGFREVAAMEAVPRDETMDDLRYLLGYSEEQIKSKSDNFLPIWEKAMEKVSKSKQENVNQDFVKLENYYEQKAIEKKRAEKERAALRKLYRAKVLGEPYPGKEFPSASDRLPSSEDE